MTRRLANKIKNHPFYDKRKFLVLTWKTKAIDDYANILREQIFFYENPLKLITDSVR